MRWSLYWKQRCLDILQKCALSVEGRWKEYVAPRKYISIYTDEIFSVGYSFVSSDLHTHSRRVCPFRIGLYGYPALNWSIPYFTPKWVNVDYYFSLKNKTSYHVPSKKKVQDMFEEPFAILFGVASGSGMFLNSVDQSLYDFASLKACAISLRVWQNT